MSLTKNSHAIVLDAGRFNTVWAVAFHPDGIHLFSGNDDGIRRWRLADASGQEVGKQQMHPTTAISVSKDCKWIVCGTSVGASVWDEKIQAKVLEVGGTRSADAVDISPDATRFATGGNDEVSIWNIVTGEKLVQVGPLQHDYSIAGVKFSPNGDYLATAYDDSIHVFDSRNGDQLITINACLEMHSRPITPLGWSNNGQQNFVASHNNQIKAFEVSTGSLLVESHVRCLHTGDDSDFRRCIALAANGKFLATFAPHAISFWDASTLARIGPVIEDSDRLRSIALSTDYSYVTTGRYDGKIMIRNISDILPDSYGPFHAAAQQQLALETLEGGLKDEQPSVSRAYDNKVAGSTLTPYAVEHHDTAELSWSLPMVKRWLQTVIRRGDKNQGSHQPDRLSREPGQPSHSRSRFNSQVKGNTAIEDSSRMAAAVSEARPLW